MQSTCSEKDLTSYLCVKVAEKFPSKADAAYPYSEVLHKSFLFYYQQRSGKLPHQVCPLRAHSHRHSSSDSPDFSMSFIRSQGWTMLPDIAADKYPQG